MLYTESFLSSLLDYVKVPFGNIRKCLSSYTGKDMQNTILKLLEKWQRQRERNAREER